MTKRLRQKQVKTKKLDPYLTEEDDCQRPEEKLTMLNCTMHGGDDDIVAFRGLRTLDSTILEKWRQRDNDDVAAACLERASDRHE
ncbi:hypothetical protein AHAS_Ahas15G0275100 [Arachis hypogaea]